jgi:hypothetical protein
MQDNRRVPIGKARRRSTFGKRTARGGLLLTGGAAPQGLGHCLSSRYGL